MKIFEVEVPQKKVEIKIQIFLLWFSVFGILFSLYYIFGIENKTGSSPFLTFIIFVFNICMALHSIHTLKQKRQFCSIDKNKIQYQNPTISEIVEVNWREITQIAWHSSGFTIYRHTSFIDIIDINNYFNQQTKIDILGEIKTQCLLKNIECDF